MIDKILADLRKVYGENSVGIANDSSLDFGGFSTGSIQMDAILGGNGFPRGRLTEIFGPESSGKTTSALHAIADCQKKGLKALFVDFEGTYDKIYAANLGVDNKSLIYIPPTSGEIAMAIAEKICKSGEIGIVVIDSIAAMLPGKIEEDDYGKANMAYHAKLVSEVVKRLVPIQYTHKIAVVVLNQLRDKPGVSFGNPEYSTGGNALKYYAAVRIDIRKSGSLYKDKEGNIVGEPRKVKIIKSKINASANKTFMIDIIYGQGIDRISEIVEAGTELGLITKAGSWYSYEGTKIGQGTDSVKEFLSDNEELANTLAVKIFNLLLIKSPE